VFRRNNGNGELGITSDRRTDAESTRRSTAGWVIDFAIPLAMSLALAISVMLLAGAAMWALRAMGREVFWLVQIALIGANVIWIVTMAMRIDYRRYDDGLHISIASLIGGFLIAFSTGWLAIAVDRVIYEFGLQTAQVIPLVGAVTFTFFLALRYVQVLGLFGSPFIEKAVGLLLTQKDAPHWANREHEPEPPPEPTTVTVEYVQSSSDGKVQSIVNFDLGITDAKMVQVAQRVLQGAPFSEPGLAGRGQPLSGPKFRELRDKLIEFGFAAWVNPDNHLGGADLTGPGGALIRRFAEFAGGNGHDRPTPA
jgi:hypothetical protein